MFYISLKNFKKAFRHFLTANTKQNSDEYLVSYNFTILMLQNLCLCKILILSFAHKMDFAHNFSVDFF